MGDDASGKYACSGLQEGGLFLLDICEELDVDHVLNVTFLIRRAVRSRDTFGFKSPCKANCIRVHGLDFWCLLLLLQNLLDALQGRSLLECCAGRWFMQSVIKLPMNLCRVSSHKLFQVGAHFPLICRNVHIDIANFKID